jgi:hypothetical protein
VNKAAEANCALENGTDLCTHLKDWKDEKRRIRIAVGTKQPKSRSKLIVIEELELRQRFGKIQATKGELYLLQEHRWNALESLLPLHIH